MREALEFGGGCPLSMIDGELRACIAEDDPHDHHIYQIDEISGEQQETIDTQEGKRMAVKRVERVVAALDEFRSALSDWIDSAGDEDTDESMAALLAAFDGDKEINHIDNLEYATQSENEIHAFANGLKQRPKGILHPGAKLTEAQVREIREAEGLQWQIGECYGIKQTTVSDIKRRKLWPHID